MKFTLIPVAALAACLAQGVNAQAAPDGNPTGWYIQVGPGSITFDESATIAAGGAVIPGAGADLSNNGSLALGIGYRLNPNVSLLGLIGVPPTTSIYGTGPIAGLRAGRVTYGPSMLVANYHMTQLGKFQPFVGAGLTYTVVLDQDGDAINNLEVDNALGGVMRAGFDYMFDDHKGMFLSVQKLFVETNISGTIDPAIPGLGGAPVSGKIGLDPLIIHAGYTYRF